MEQLQDFGEEQTLSYLSARERTFAVYRCGQVFRKASVIASDGAPLSIFEAGDPKQPTVLLVNALGVTCLFLAAVAERLAGAYHVLTWESRGLPDVRVAGADADLSVRRHALDACDVLAAKRVEADAVVAYCSGVNVAVYAAAEELVRAERLCLISPSVQVGATAQTDYQRKMLPTWENVARAGTQYAALVRVLLLQNARSDDGSIDYELACLNNLPFHSDQTTYRYARMQTECMRIEWPRLAQNVRADTLVVHASEDDMIHVETSQAVARSIPGAAFRSIHGGHFAVYSSDELHDEVAAFVGSNQAHGKTGRSYAERDA